MKSFVGLALLPFALLGAAKYTKEDYESGLVHNQIIERKLVSKHTSHAQNKANGSRLLGQDN
jgi:hypothetical protein